MTNEYLAAELCELHFNGIDDKTFRRNKKHYIALLEAKGFSVTEGKRGRYITYILTPKEKTEQQKAKDEFLEIINCEIGKHDIELLKFLLKTIMEKKVVPVQDEFVNLGLHENIITAENRSKVKNYLTFLKENKIIVEPLETPVWIYNEGVLPDYDPETGEIFPTYYKKHVRYVYYDYGKDGRVANREKLSDLTQKVFHEAFKRIFAEEYQIHIIPLKKSKMPKAFISEAVTKLQRKTMRELGQDYGIHACERVEEPIISWKVKFRLEEYFGLNKPVEANRDIEIDVSKIPLVEVNRPVGKDNNKMVQLMEYQNLLRQRAQLYKEGKNAFPLHLYEKWHGEEEFAKAVNEETKPVLKIEDDIPSLMRLKILKNIKL